MGRTRLTEGNPPADDRPAKGGEGGVMGNTVSLKLSELLPLTALAATGLFLKHAGEASLRAGCAPVP